jgi:hypothetical protein
MMMKKKRTTMRRRRREASERVSVGIRILKCMFLTYGRIFQFLVLFMSSVRVGHVKTKVIDKREIFSAHYTHTHILLEAREKDFPFSFLFLARTHMELQHELHSLSMI